MWFRVGFMNETFQSGDVDRARNSQIFIPEQILAEFSLDERHFQPLMAAFAYLSTSGLANLRFRRRLSEKNARFWRQSAHQNINKMESKKLHGRVAKIGRNRGKSFKWTPRRVIRSDFPMAKRIYRRSLALWTVNRDKWNCQRRENIAAECGKLIGSHQNSAPRFVRWEFTSVTSREAWIELVFPAYAPEGRSHSFRVRKLIESGSTRLQTFFISTASIARVFDELFSAFIFIAKMLFGVQKSSRFWRLQILSAGLS